MLELFSPTSRGCLSFFSYVRFMLVYGLLLRILGPLSRLLVGGLGLNVTPLLSPPSLFPDSG